MVRVITLNLQKKCILVAKKGCNLQWQISYALLFFEKNFLFLDQFFLFFDLDCQNLTAFGFDNHPDLKKERIDRGKEKVSLRKETAHASFAFPATKKIYSKLCRWKNIIFDKPAQFVLLCYSQEQNVYESLYNEGIVNKMIHVYPTYKELTELLKPHKKNRSMLIIDDGLNAITMI